jgi:hypothetical protein
MRKPDGLTIVEILNDMEISADNGIWNLQGQKMGAMVVTDTARVRSVFQGIGYWQVTIVLLAVGKVRITLY